MKSIRRIPLFGLLALGVLLAAMTLIVACGGDDEAAPAAPAATTAPAAPAATTAPAAPAATTAPAACGRYLRQYPR